VSSPADVRARTLDELRRVIRRIESVRAARPAPEPVETIVGGHVVETEAGCLLVVRHEYPLEHRHGRLALGEARGAPRHLVDVIARDGNAPDDLSRLLFLDTETTGLAGGTGTYAFLVGAGWLEDERFVVAQYFMRDFDEEPALLASLEPVLARASGVVTFNGAGFDLPLLETRFIMARKRWPVTLCHLDLLRPARRVWATRLEDCRLTTLEREVLGLVREADVPGGLIPTLYFEYLRSRRAGPLARVFAHNRADVLSLVTLLGWFTRALEADADAIHADELAGLGRLFEPLDLERAIGYYRASLNAGLSGPGGQWVRLRLALWAKRRAEWDAACTLWQASTATRVFDARPWEELAKYHEHRRRDAAAARAIVIEALALARAAPASARVVDALAYRLARLERRLASTCVHE
jgi:uncharacterized protein YprB with RNaseH-like and TPR domain